MLWTIIAVALGVALGLKIYKEPDEVIGWIREFLAGVILFVTRPIRFLFGATQPQIDARNKKKEEEKEAEYQEALAKGDKNAKVSKDYYFLSKAIKEVEEDKKKKKKEDAKKQAIINKYGMELSEKEIEEMERIKKQKEEYEALPQEEKDRLKKKRKRDWIIIIVALLSPYILMGLIFLVARIMGR